jgi:hypothetical protein
MNGTYGFTDAEWQTLQFTPLWTFVACAGADRNIDDKEKAAFAKELAEAGLYKSALAREVLGSLAANLSTIMPAFTADSRSYLAGMSNAADVLDQKVPAEEANDFKKAILGIGIQVCQASGGGFMGKGDKISEEEKKNWAICAAAIRATI